VLCAPLVAGCGAATRVNFASHSRPASPIDVSVVANPEQGMTFDPSTITPGPVLFNILNLNRRSERFSVRAAGHLLARSPQVAPGATAQLKATLSGPGTTIVDFSQTLRSSLTLSMDFNVSGRSRTGDNELTQP
jgi:hypothetical protein